MCWVISVCTGTDVRPNLSKEIVAVILGGLLLQWLPRSAYLKARELFTRAPAPAQAVVLFVLAIVLRQAASAEAVPFVYGQF